MAGKSSEPPAKVETPTYCRICEAFCGLIATVESGTVVKLRPDPEHLSQGFACPKGVSYTEIHQDPDRLNGPMKRAADGSFEPISWDQAIAEIGDRLKAGIDCHGGESVGIYVGNPMAYNDGALVWSAGLIKALKSKHYYTAASVDVQNRWISSGWMYGNPLVNPLPDIDRTDYLFMVGSNPFVSHFSMVTVPAPYRRLRDVVQRGGRVVVVDPRRTETAKEFEWVPIRPDGDVWLLLAMLQTIFAEALEDRQAILDQTTGLESLIGELQLFTPEYCTAYCGVAPDIIRKLARDLALAPRAAIHGRCGASLGAYSTIVAYLLDVLAIVTGNFDRPGGMVFGDPAIDAEQLAARAGVATVGAWRSRIGGFREVMGTAPAANMAAEILTPGPGQLRSLFVFSGNPVISTPRGDKLAEAMKSLDLTVVFDLYLSDTALCADYVLPGPDWLERGGWPSFTSQNIIIPHIQWVDPVVPPRRNSRPEWWALDQICRRAGFVPVASKLWRFLDRIGVRLTPELVFDLSLRTGEFGDLFGFRRHGLNKAKLAKQSRGIKLAEHVRTGVIQKRVTGGRVRLNVPEILGDLARVRAAAPDNPGSLRLISQRELRSQNTYLHNSAKLTARRRWTLKINPADASARGIGDGDIVAVTSCWGRITAPVEITDDMLVGALALPHGWGHSGGGALAKASDGSSYNILTPTDPEELDHLSGNARLNGILVSVDWVAHASAQARVRPPSTMMISPTI